VSDASLGEIERVYRAQLRRYRRVARAILRDEEAARDVVQEAFASAVRGRRGFRGEGSLEAWIWRMVLNVALAEQRRRRAAPASALDERHEQVSRNGQGELEARAALGVSLLPERQRLIVFLHYYADLDYRAIADTLEISSGTVAASLHAARATLSLVLTSEEVER
jgi:RNA polymerase sigma-70 factor (ECF subfamily)